MQGFGKVPASETGHQASAWRWIGLLVVIALGLALFTVYDQVVHRKGVEYLWDTQLRFHRWIMEGVSPAPWQYRVLTAYLMEGVIRWFQALGHPSPHAIVFVAFRVLENTAIFALCGLYWEKLRIRRVAILIGLMCLAWGMTYAGYRSHLAFDTYLDVAFYLLAALIILDHKDVWLIPLIAVAALNRETSALIPFLLLAARVGSGLKSTLQRQTAVLFIAGVLLFGFVFLGLRAAYGPRELMAPYEHHLGADLLMYNLANPYTYYSLFATFGFISLLSLARWRQWPTVLQRWFWVLVPLWAVVHAIASVVAEARLFLVPYVLVVLPSALLALGEDSAGQGGRA